ncbi:uncharacterized protein Z518_06627 [Rhinocladiella mackenziei CBS 650.93]|uniref:MARVEL domain-containing protein n=1 Tax=Rhinocladiella mackenziei CBS 650.93 TaxID=1442369 RepID=A0A0D2FM88_9EURO|nr:uncharacterized protein Z518_06627 [Rhinocladiella mackenziei CBS 650.93]KIX03077.1 hypothetical protein Z518_06627 [Rhinocladiella mackenziei CBS 650.93]
MLGIEGLTDASFKGDVRWARTAKWCGYAPIVVSVICVLSMVEIALGAVWIASLKTDLNFAQVIQPILIPGLCFFNAIPSLHLHVLARVNPPRLALWFSTTLSITLLVSSVLFLGACVGNNSRGSLQRSECPGATGGLARIWDIMVALQLVSAVLYGLVAAMAWTVKRALEAREQRIATGEEMVSQEEKERRESEARERWKYLSAG